MLNQSVVIILIIGFFVLLIGFLIAIGFLIYASLELKRVSSSFREFLKSTEDRMNPLLQEAEQTLKSIRKVSDDVGDVTGNVRSFSESINEVAKNLEAISSIVGDLREGVSLRVLGLKAGIKAATEVLIKQIKQRRV